MGRKALLFVVAAILGLGVVPAVAFGTLVNEYGLHYAGQSSCVCHQNKMNTLHGQFATPGLTPTAPSGWSVFKAAGDPPVVAGTKNAYFNSGGSYSISGLQWVTLGNYNANSATEYLVWKGSTDATVMPWNLIEGLVAEAGGGYDVGGEAPTTGLYDVTYSCQRCHQLGATKPAASATFSVPNPAASVSPSPGTAMQWARDTSKSVSDFMTDPAVSQAGLASSASSATAPACTSPTPWTATASRTPRSPTRCRATRGRPRSASRRCAASATAATPTCRVPWASTASRPTSRCATSST